MAWPACCPAMLCCLALVAQTCRFAVPASGSSSFWHRCGCPFLLIQLPAEGRGCQLLSIHLC
jgi:hypothetical protein